MSLPYPSLFRKAEPERGDHSTARGRAAEDRALAFLRRHGCRLIARNYRIRNGELDLIVRDGTTLVFVEVKFRADPTRGSGTESVDTRKQERLARTAQHFLAYANLPDFDGCRFDVVTVGDDINWFQNAFTLDS